jgi:prepilin-type N-terminal cleavage/methylation domain-containing protein
VDRAERRAMAAGELGGTMRRVNIHMGEYWHRRPGHGPGQAGFTLTEVLLATVVLLVGLVAVAQLVPLSLFLNGANRIDSTSLVIAQREMDYLLAQPVNQLSFSDPQGVGCPLSVTCNLGDPTQPNVIVGNPVVVVGSTPVIDFSASMVTGYSFPDQYVDPNDPSGATYDVRWAVITSATGGNVAGKRFFVGVRKQGGNAFYPPITLDSQVQK